MAPDTRLVAGILGAAWAAAGLLIWSLIAAARDDDDESPIPS
jgi:hypothetical protein